MSRAVLKPPPRRREPHAGGSQRETENNRPADSNAPAEPALQPCSIICIRDDGRHIVCGQAHRELAERVAARLQQHGMHAIVELVEATS